MPIQAEKIAQTLEKLLEELGNSENLVNPYFRISKGAPEQIHRYFFINAKFQRFIAVTQLIFGIIMLILKVLFLVSASLVFVTQYRFFKFKNKPKQILFVSHGIGNNLTLKESDQFFWKMPEYLQNKGKEVCIVYTNHYIFGFTKHNKLLQSKFSDIERFLMPKFLRPSENFTYFKKISILAVKSLRLAISKLRKEPTEFAILIKASIFFYSRATYSNYLLNQRIQEIVSFKGINTVALTFEGHSYEQFVIDETFKRFGNLNVLLYQHSPIVKDHFGITTFLKKTEHKLLIFTTGSYYKNLFAELSNKHRIEILGSNKSNKSEVTATLTVTPHILFVPESTTHATKDMLILLRRMIKTDMDYFYTLRLHPNLKLNVVLFWYIKKLQTSKKFVISKNILPSDLASAQFVVYRSSAVGIESLKFSAIPIFYGSQENYGLNVLGHLDTKFPAVFSADEAIAYFESTLIAPEDNNREEIFYELFERMDYNKLDILLDF
jgi:hypothetical protein